MLLYIKIVLYCKHSSDSLKEHWESNEIEYWPIVIKRALVGLDQKGRSNLKGKNSKHQNGLHAGTHNRIDASVHSLRISSIIHF